MWSTGYCTLERWSDPKVYRQVSWQVGRQLARQTDRDISYEGSVYDGMPYSLSKVTILNRKHDRQLKSSLGLGY